MILLLCVNAADDVDLRQDADTALRGQRATLHHLGHSALPRDAEDGASAPSLMTTSGHASIRALGKYARPSTGPLAA